MRKPITLLVLAVALVGVIYFAARTALDILDFGKMVEVLRPFEVDPDTTQTTQNDVEPTVQNDPSVRFIDAPEAVQQIAMQIAMGDIPDTDLLASLTPEQLDASYSQPFSKIRPVFGHTLLREAVVQLNPDAAAALIAAGARSDYNDNEMPYQAVLLKSSLDRVWFPDYEKGNALLQLWLDNGGSPNQLNAFYGTLGPLLNNVPSDNLEALVILLKAGADPWASIVTNVSTSGWESKSRPFMLVQANASPNASEIMFRLGKEGVLTKGTPAQMEEMDALYQRATEQYLGSTGPANLITVWGLQMAINEVYGALDLPLAGDIATLMDMQVPANIGGFFLAPGEIRSPNDPDQLVTNDNQTGTERWDG
jgi:hypothetical protein